MSLAYPKTPRAYAERVRDHVDRSLEDGLDFGPSAQFLLRGTRTDISTQDDSHAPSGFLIYYDLQADGNLVSRQVGSPNLLESFQGYGLGKGLSGRLMFLRGYPSAEWLATIGCTHLVDAELWRRHLGFLTNVPSGGFTQQPMLPSATSQTFSLRFTSIGFHGPIRRKQYPQRIEKLREEAAASMGNYHERLRTGRTWDHGDSVVRKYVVHDEEHFSIHQTATVHLQQQGSSDQWLLIVFMDCGEDLAKAPPGPWRRDLNQRVFGARTQLLMAPQQKSYTFFQTTSWNSTQSVDEQDVSLDDRLPQRLSRIPLQYGRYLDHEVMREDPFYALHSIFDYIASSECQMLDLIQNKLDTHSKLDITADVADHGMSQSNLVHFQEVLEQCVAQLEETLRIIEKRGAVWWPKAQEGRSMVAESAAALLQEDYEYLLHRAKTLLSRSERSMTMTMNMLSIEEARRSVKQNTTLFRFTVVASIYIPLSFTSSFFGMNFVELGQGSLSIWIFFAACAPVFIISALCLFISRSRLERLRSAAINIFDIKQ